MLRRLKNEEAKREMKLFAELERILRRPKPFEYYTSPQLWNDQHISKGMLDAHLDPSHDAASFNREFIDRSVDWISSRFIVPGKTRICDFGCGPGLWTTRFAERGAMVTGVDLSESSIHYARAMAKQKNLAIRYILGDYLQLSLHDQFDLVTMIGGDFSVLSPDQRRALLRKFRALLRREGALLLDVASRAQWPEAAERTQYEFSSAGGFWSSAPHHVFTCAYKYEQENLLCHKYTVIEESRVLEIYVWNQCYDMESLKELFKENGFRIREFLSDVAGTPFEDDTRWIAVVALEST